ncbi:PREDICTED: tripartite motif-containing protein 3-like [Amphimedon queenslandica]|uniref:RING-type domain-containing protein n=1 Tax=Amphimedon queenslandica TaxID=400682 RepID=A0A1X7VQ00_AMPQE|nr:PREDICTED: tripartite motif-containing protein 3-like [Amphimedon queenslandica]|eukprot:XP_011409678.1 PREDICTED: tripartite motif-containing protein 3-like [Amphimedon queenslandica]
MACSSSSVALKLEELLTCSICRDSFTNPRILPCYHSFCQRCLERVPQNKKNEVYYLSCPVCRNDAEIPKEGFPTSFFINNLKDMQDSIVLIDCFDHKKPLDLFCDKCNTLICSTCAVSHKGHGYQDINLCYGKHRVKLEECLEKVKAKEDKIKKKEFVKSLNDREKEIIERGAKIKKEIHDTTEKLIANLRCSEEKLIKQADNITYYKVQSLSKQKESAEAILSQLKCQRDLLSEILQEDIHQQVFMLDKFCAETTKYIDEINLDELNPNKNADFVLNKKARAPACTCMSIGEIIEIKALERFKVEIDSTQWHSKNKISFQLSMVKVKDSSLLNVSESFLQCSLVQNDRPNELIVATVARNAARPGVYTIKCEIKVTNAYTVKLQLDDFIFEDTPMIAPINPYLFNVTAVQKIPGFCLPHAIAINDDSANHIAVVEKDGVTILNKEIVKENSFKMEGGKICGAAITKNFVLVSSIKGIQKIRMDEGTPKVMPLKIRKPHGIAISPATGQVYFADSGHHCVQVLKPDLTFSHSFGKEGPQNGNFTKPYDVAVDSRGYVYVTDSCSNRIQKFNSDGAFQIQFCIPENFKCPRFIAVDNEGYVYVSQKKSSHLSIFTSDGVFICFFDIEGVDGEDIHVCGYPTGLAFDRDGSLYVCDSENVIKCKKKKEIVI